MIYFLCVFFRFPAPVQPTVSLWADMINAALSLAIVGYVINLAIGRTLAAKHGFDVDPNQVEKLRLLRGQNVCLVPL